MRCVAIISCSECALLYGGVTLRSGGGMVICIDMFIRISIFKI